MAVGAGVGAGSSRKATSASGGAESGTHPGGEESAAAGRSLIAAEVAAGAVDSVRRTNVVSRRDVGSVVAAAAGVGNLQTMAMLLTRPPVGTNFAAESGNCSRCCLRCCCCYLFDARWCLDWVSSVARPASAAVPPRRGPTPVSGAGPPRTPVCAGPGI